MLNKEKYAKEILDIACEGWVLAIDKQHNNNPISCTILSCDKCAFNEPSRDCRTLRKEWCEQEYVEPPVDWTKVAVDTPILVSYDGENWHKRFCNSVSCDGKLMCKDCEEYIIFKKNIEIIKAGVKNETD